MSYDFNASFFVVLGLTGAGKSFFINTISDTDSCKVADSEKSCTQMNEMVSFVYYNHRYITLDTPGLDDSDNNDEKIMTVKQILNIHKDVKMLITY